MSKLTFKFKNGVEITGTVEQLEQYAKLIGETLDLYATHYNSSTRGLILLADMNVNHLKNALLKISREYIDDLGKRQLHMSLKQFLTEYIEFGSNQKIAGIFQELIKRPEYNEK